MDEKYKDAVISNIEQYMKDDETILAFKNVDSSIVIETLESGDIVQGNYAIEHKKPADFWASLFPSRSQYKTSLEISFYYSILLNIFSTKNNIKIEINIIII